MRTGPVEDDVEDDVPAPEPVRRLGSPAAHDRGLAVACDDASSAGTQTVTIRSETGHRSRAADRRRPRDLARLEPEHRVLLAGHRQQLQHRGAEGLHQRPAQERASGRRRHAESELPGGQGRHDHARAWCTTGRSPRAAPATRPSATRSRFANRRSGSRFQRRRRGPRPGPSPAPTPRPDRDLDHDGREAARARTRHEPGTVRRRGISRRGGRRSGVAAEGEHVGRGERGGVSRGVGPGTGDDRGPEPGGTEHEREARARRRR